jgi:hypothetical protein
MRILALLMLAGLVAGCAHIRTGRALRAEAEQAVDTRLATEGVCLIVGSGDDDAGDAAEDGIALVARPGTGFDSARRARLDALAEAGLLTVDSTRRRGDGAALRIYRFTELGERHLRGPELGLGPPENQARFCYGRSAPVRLMQIDWSSSGGCGPDRLQVGLLFVYREIPEWAEHPSLRAAFPEWVGRAGADVVRYQSLGFERTGRGWERPYPHDLFNCVGDRVRPRTRSIRT